MPERLERDHEAPEALEPVEDERLTAEPVEDGAVEDGASEAVASDAMADQAFEVEASDAVHGDYEAPSPIEHAAPDAEIAEARLELGGLDQLEDEQAPSQDELEPTEADIEDESEAPSSGELEVSTRAEAHRRELPSNRLVGFLQGSWRELQRVQWPDRRQVMQATGVVIGFVIVAGVFLGVSDWVAGKVVSLIINGHF